VVGLIAEEIQFGGCKMIEDGQFLAFWREIANQFYIHIRGATASSSHMDRTLLIEFRTIIC
jgi:hypothetical protein